MRAHAHGGSAAAARPCSGQRCACNTALALAASAAHPTCLPPMCLRPARGRRLCPGATSSSRRTRRATRGCRPRWSCASRSRPTCGACASSRRTRASRSQSSSLRSAQTASAPSTASTITSAPPCTTLETTPARPTRVRARRALHTHGGSAGMQTWGCSAMLLAGIDACARARNHCAHPPRHRRAGLSEDHRNKIMDTVIALNILLDVPKPWTCARARCGSRARAPCWLCRCACSHPCCVSVARRINQQHSTAMVSVGFLAAACCLPACCMRRDCARPQRHQRVHANGGRDRGAPGGRRGSRRRAAASGAGCAAAARRRSVRPRASLRVVAGISFAAAALPCVRAHARLAVARYWGPGNGNRVMIVLHVLQVWAAAFFQEPTAPPQQQ